MKPKENARQPWEAMRAHVRKHESIIARLRGEELPITRRDERIIGAAFCACLVAITIWGLLA